MQRYIAMQKKAQTNVYLENIEGFKIAHGMAS